MQAKEIFSLNKKRFIKKIADNDEYCPSIDLSNIYDYVKGLEEKVQLFDKIVEITDDTECDRL